MSCFGPHPSLLPPCPSPSLLSSFLPQWGPPIAKDQTFHLVLNSSPSCLLGDLIALTPSLLYPVSSDLFVLVPSQQHLNPLKFTNIKKKNSLLWLSFLQLMPSIWSPFHSFGISLLPLFPTYMEGGTWPHPFTKTALAMGPCELLIVEQAILSPLHMRS